MASEPLKDRVVLSEMLKANRRMNALLARQVQELEVLLAEDTLPDGGEYPTWYGVVGNDGEPGFLIGDENPVGTGTTPTLDNRHFQGRVVIDSDAPFVWTGILATARYARDANTTPTVMARSYQGIQGGAGVGGNTTDDDFPDIRLGFVEAGSGRELFQAQEDAQGGVLLSSEMFNTQRIYGSYDNVEASAPGHGPNEAFQLPAKTVLSANDVILINAQASFFNFLGVEPLRLYVTLLGYKVFGD